MALKLETYYAKIILAQKYSSPLLNRIVINKALANGAEDYYQNSQSIIEYPRYLFREDIRQKWTNEQTVDNICIFPADANTGNLPPLMSANGFNVYSFADKSILFNCLLIYQHSFFAGISDHTSRYKRAAARRIRFFDMTVEDGFTLQDIIAVLSDILNAGNNAVPICAVYHQDEDYDHVHFLYMIDPAVSLSHRQLKKIPHIEAMIKERYDTSHTVFPLQ